MTHTEVFTTAYFEAKSHVKNAGFEKEWEWQNSLNFEDFSEVDLLRETAWVILCSGFREKVVRKFFDYISLCFCDWESALEIVSNKNFCKETALLKMKNEKKIEALITVAQIILDNGFETIKEKILHDPLAALRIFPFIGEITALHLAKNLGLNIAKPDRHLVKLSNEVGFKNVQGFCSLISELTGDPIALVDLIIWRYSTLERNYLKHFSRHFFNLYSDGIRLTVPPPGGAIV